jgi:hypothetical protein
MIFNTKTQRREGAKEIKIKILCVLAPLRLCVK